MLYSFSDFETNTQKALEHVRREVSFLRTGRASAEMLDPVVVEAYGQQMKLVELASISVPDASLIKIAPWDKGLLGTIEKAIQIASLNLNPVVDGEIIRIVVPSLTSEKRQEMVKELHKRIENGKAMLRDVRSKAKQEIEAQKGESGISEDDVTLDLEDLEARHKKAVDQLEVLLASKEKLLLTI
ncbi:MAG: ribosome recycling factor [Candidatus Pacebacteria bacterium CG_4_10_14_0_8_um_filter_43_12]|nr:MAG: ribosome recycling factor [Candidatus Pacebacteria bacterium CG10_big_fil_rev_8_21_14_0_10_44_11]PIY79481.1 MAG: ribosome recycling factor [Candidatus Pacebacteria bacterium CG_4_10_14_0_8_um_filter_43_12]